MEAFISFLESFAPIRFLFSYLNVSPVHYKLLFPSFIPNEEIQSLYDEGLIPGLHSLLPAVFWALFLSLIRMLLQGTLFKVFLCIL